MYRNSLVGDAFDRIEIEAFSKGSVLVDYYVYFNNFDEGVQTNDLKVVLNQQFESSDGQPRLGRFTVDPHYTDFIGETFRRIFQKKSYIKFSLVSVLDNEVPAPATDNDGDSVLPDWAIAVIVIGLGSLAFVLIFGITVVSVNTN